MSTCRMPRRPGVGLLALAALALTACSDAVDLGQTAWQAELSVGPEGLTGSVAAVSVGNRTEASIQLERAAPGERYDWRIHAGDCEAAGAIVGGAAVYPRLVAGQDGRAEAETVLSQTLGAGPYAARVLHVLPDGAEQPAACAPLERAR